MRINFFNKSFVIATASLSTFAMQSAFVKPLYSQEGDPIYYDAFYEEYYNSFPKRNPNNVRKSKSKGIYESDESLNISSKKSEKVASKKSKNNTTPEQPQHQYRLPSDWESMYYNEAMRYWEYTTRPIRLDIAYQYVSSQFEFEMASGSLLKWDRLNTSQFKFNMSKDFKISGERQYVANIEYQFGSAKSDYTLDDDLWNDLHIFSAGKGSGKTSNLKASIGMRNFFRVYGWNITPSLGFQMKQADLKMTGHGQPLPFFLNCGSSNGFCEFTIDGVNYYLEDGTLIPEGDVTLFDDVFNPAYTVYFDPDVFNNLFGGYSSVSVLGDPSHYYDVSWMGPYIALDLEKVISIRESLTFRFELFTPYYNAKGVWPGRREWKDFYDKGGLSIGYSIGAIYTMKITPSFGIYGSVSVEYISSGNMDTQINYNCAYTDCSTGPSETFKKEIMRAEWDSTILEIGLKYMF